MKIRSIDVHGLWKCYDLHWELNKNVNILTGINGAGKTTLFDLTASLLSRGRLSKDYVSKAEKIVVTFEDGYVLTNINFDNTLNELKQRAGHDEVYSEIWDDVSEKFKKHERKSLLANIGIQASICRVTHNGKNIPIEPFLEKLNISILSTFDDPLSASLDKVSIVGLREEGIRSSLDFDLKTLQEGYAIYLANLANRLEHYAVNGRLFDIEYIKSLYERKNTFLDILDSLFAETLKRVDRNSSKLRFISDIDGKLLEINQLSSGEKQLISVLITTILQEGEDVIFFMDEPEISLHVDWQEQLIDVVKTLNPNCQLIISSHAPAVLMRGWHSAVQNLEDLKTRVHGI